MRSFSSTLMPGNTNRPSGTCTMPGRTIAAVSRPPIASPSKWIDPDEPADARLVDRSNGERSMILRLM